MQQSYADAYDNVKASNDSQAKDQEEEYSHSYADEEAEKSHEEPKSSHGMALHMTGGHVEPAGYVDPELAAAAVSPHSAVIQVGEHSVTAPFHKIDKEKVELACDEYGCALIPDDGNPHNDIDPSDYAHIHDQQD